MPASEPRARVHGCRQISLERDALDGQVRHQHAGGVLQRLHVIDVHNPAVVVMTYFPGWLRIIAFGDLVGGYSEWYRASRSFSDTSARQ